MRGDVATLLGVVGGILIVIGVLIGGLVGFLADLVTGNGRGILELGYVGLIDLVMGVLVLLFTGYARSHPPPDKAVGGIIVLVVSAIAWFLAGDVLAYILVVVGAILGLLAGLVFLMESAFRGPPR